MFRIRGNGSSVLGKRSAWFFKPVKNSTGVSRFRLIIVMFTALRAFVFPLNLICFHNFRLYLPGEFAKQSVATRGAKYRVRIERQMKAQRVTTQRTFRTKRTARPLMFQSPGRIASFPPSVSGRQRTVGGKFQNSREESLRESRAPTTEVKGFPMSRIHDATERGW